MNRLYRTLRVDFRSKLTTSVEEKEKSLICFLFSIICPQRNTNLHNSECVATATKKFQSPQAKLFKCHIRRISKHCHNTTVTANTSLGNSRKNPLPSCKISYRESLLLSEMREMLHSGNITPIVLSEFPPTLLATDEANMYPHTS